MPFSGPQRRYQAVRPFDPYTFADALDRAEPAQPRSYGGGGIRTDLLEEDNRHREYDEAAAAELAMTPGVRRGMSVGDSPLLHSFRRGGQDYTYSPQAAGVDEGTIAGTRANTEADVRFRALSQMPGFDEKSAARLVYGRSQMAEEQDAMPVRNAIAEYMRTPTRELAAKAIQLGANLNSFPDRFVGDPALSTAPKVTRGPNGEIGLLDPATNEVTWSTVAGTGEPAMGAAPGASHYNGPTEEDRQISSQQSYTNSLGLAANRMIPKKRPPEATYDPAVASRFVADSTARERQYGDPFRAAQRKLAAMHEARDTMPGSPLPAGRTAPPPPDTNDADLDAFLGVSSSASTGVNAQGHRSIPGATDDATVARYRATHPPGDAPAAAPPTEEQKLWDAAVQKHGRAKVLKEYGPRPGGE